MRRIWALGAVVAAALLSPARAAPPGLPPQEREAMLSSCQRLQGDDRALCRNVVDDARVVLNDKRSCLRAMTLMLEGGVWARVRSLPPTLTCRDGLRRAGYPVSDLLRKLNGAR